MSEPCTFLLRDTYSQRSYVAALHDALCKAGYKVGLGLWTAAAHTMNRATLERYFSEDTARAGITKINYGWDNEAMAMRYWVWPRPEEIGQSEK